MSFCPRELYEVIRQRVPSFQMEYCIDPVKEAIAGSWPNYMDDTCARTEWGWDPVWDIDAMAHDMLRHLRMKLSK